MKMDKQSCIRVTMVFILLTVQMSCLPVDAYDEPLADVLIYSGAGAWSDGVVAFESFLEHKGLTWMECDGSYIEDNELIGRFDVLHFPGGDSGEYSANIDMIGLQHIRDFVSAGGGYIGICAGGYFACDRIVWEGTPYDHPLDLFLGIGSGSIHEIAPWPNYAMTTLTMNLSNPINCYASPSEYTLYYGGAAYYPDAGQEMNVIGTYDLLNDDPAMINFRYGDGRVVLSGPHPEIEEDSTRDEVVFGDDLSDLGTEWDLLWTCMDWLLGVPISEPPASLPPDAPSITGPENGKIKRTYTYHFTADDPEEEELYYWVDWGDNTTSGWAGPSASAETITLSHTWSVKGTYTINAKTKDATGNEGDWGTLLVTMPYSFDIPFWGRFFERFPHAFPILRLLLGY